MKKIFFLLLFIPFISFTQSEKDNYKKNEATYLRTIEKKPNCLNCFINLSKIYLKQDKTIKALKYANKAILIDSNAKGKIQRAEIYFSFTNYKKSLSDLNEAELEPNSNKSRIYFIKSLCYKKQNFSYMSLKYLKKAEELSPNDKNILYEISQNLINSEQYEKAIPILEKCIKLDSNNYKYYKQLGSLFSTVNKPNKSILLFKKSYEKGNKDPYQYLLIGQDYYTLEDMDSSCRYFELAFERKSEINSIYINATKGKINDICDSTKPNYYYQRGIAMYNLKKFKESIEYHKRGIKKFPKNSWIRDFLGNSFLADEQFENAIKSYKTSLSLPVDEFAKNNSKMNLIEYENSTKCMTNISISDAYFALGELSHTILYLDSAEIRLNKMKDVQLMLDWKNIITFKKGNYYYALNEKDKAIELFSEVLKVNPYNFDALYNRAVSYFEKNNSSKKRYKQISLNIQYQGVQNTVYKNTSITNSKVNKAELRQALFDLNIILTSEKKIAKVYLLRAIIKKQLQIFDYCMDIQKAEELGIIDANEIAETNCK